VQKNAAKATGGFSGALAIGYSGLLLFLLSGPASAAASCHTEVEFSTSLSSALKSTLLSAYDLSIAKELDDKRVQLSDQAENSALNTQLAQLAEIPEIRVAEYRCENTAQSLQESVSQLTLASTTPTQSSPAQQPSATAEAEPIKDEVIDAIPAAIVDKNIPVPPAIIGGLAVDTSITECQASILFSATATADQRAKTYETLSVIPSGQQANGAQLVKPFFSLEPRTPHEIAGQAQKEALVVEAGVVCP
jgi:hypothetical protein